MKFAIANMRKYAKSIKEYLHTFIKKSYINLIPIEI